MVRMQIGRIQIAQKAMHVSCWTHPERKAEGSSVQWSEDSCVEIPAEEARQEGNAAGGEPFLFLLNVKCQNWTSNGVTAED